VAQICGEADVNKLWVILAIVIPAGFLAVAYHVFQEKAFFYAYLALVAFYWSSVVVTGKANPLHLVMGADGRLSTSKFQFFVWTAVVVFVYALLFWYRGKTDAISSIPQNVLIAMGLSIVTAVGAKGITVSYLNSGSISKPASDQPGGTTDLSALVTRDGSSAPDLTKIQMLIWTVIAVAVYLHTVYYSLSKYRTCAAKDCVFPDIDTSLMVLMGLSQGAYLGNKLVAAGSPQVSTLSPAVGLPGADVTISGQSLGSTQNGNLILINGQNQQIAATSWTDSAVHFSVPQRRADGTAWHADERINVGVAINGQQTSNLSFAFASQPVILTPNPIRPPQSSQVTLTGRNFGVKQAGSRLLLNNIDCSTLINSWSDTQVQFTLQNVLPGGAPWAAGAALAIQIAIANDFISAPLNTTTT
jgi:hypothetical protein